MPKIELSPERIVKQYTYRPGFQALALTLPLLLIVAGALITEQSENPNFKFDARNKDLIFWGCVILLVTIGLIASIYSSKKITITNDSIIGPVMKALSNNDTEIKFQAINKLYIRNVQFPVIVIESNHATMILDPNKLKGNDFPEVYNILAEKINQPLFHEEASDYDKLFYAPLSEKFKKQKGLWLTLGHGAFGLTFVGLFFDYNTTQIDNGYGILFSIAIVGLWLRYLSKNFVIVRPKTNYYLGLACMIILVLISTLTSTLGLSGFYAFINQKLDSSLMSEHQTYLVKDEFQDEEGIREKGYCYKIADYKDPNNTFGPYDICEKLNKDVSANKKVIVQYKSGFLADRWMVSYKLKD